MTMSQVKADCPPGVSGGIFIIVVSFPNACTTPGVYDIINQKEFGKG